MPTVQARFFVLLGLVVVAAAGSAPAAQWTSIGPDGGEVDRLMVHPTRPELLMVAIGRERSWEQVFLSIDGGERWQRLPGRELGTIMVGVRSAAFDPWDHHRLWLGTNGGLFVSPDLGRSWHQLSGTGGLQEGPCTLVAADPITPGLIRAVCAGILSASRDEGATWDPLPSQPDLVYGPGELVADPFRAGHLLAADVVGTVSETSDDGATWTPVARTGDASDGLSTIRFSLAWPDRVWARTPGGRLVRSEDGGRTWSPGGAGVPDDVVVADLAVTGGPDEERVALATSFGAYLRVGEGIFEPCAAQASRRRIALVAAAGERLWVTLDRAWREEARAREVWRSLDSGRSWRPASAGLAAIRVRDLAVDPRSPGSLWAATDHGLWHRDGVGGAWIWVGPDPAGKPVLVVTVHPADPDTLYLTQDEGGYLLGLITNDGGESWHPLELCYINCCDPLPGARYCVAATGRPVFDPRDPDLVLFRGGFGGLRCASGRSPGQCDVEQLTGIGRFVRDVHDPDRLIGWSGSSVWESRDNAETWTMLVDWRQDTREVEDLVVDPLRPGTISVRVRSGIMVSRDDGASWASAGQELGIECYMIGSTPTSGHWCWPSVLDLEPAEDGRAVLALDDDPRTWWSTDAGLTWRPVEVRGPAFPPSVLVSDPTIGVVYAGSIGLGVARLDGLGGRPPRRPTGRVTGPPGNRSRVSLAYRE